MKMLIAIVQAKDAKDVRKAFVKERVQFTRLQATGGFLREREAVYMVVVDDDRVDFVLNLIKENANTRDRYVTPPSTGDRSMTPAPVQVQVGGANVFVLPVDQRLRF